MDAALTVEGQHYSGPTPIYVVMTYIVMFYIVMPCMVMAYLVMAHIVMAYIVMALYPTILFFGGARRTQLSMQQPSATVSTTGHNYVGYNCIGP